LAEPQLQKLRQMLQELVHKAQVSVEQIADVELIGGSTRIPCIKQAIAGSH
jgi:molecular chaperone DnaK (HSP70)